MQGKERRKIEIEDFRMDDGEVEARIKLQEIGNDGERDSSAMICLRNLRSGH